MSSEGPLIEFSSFDPAAPVGTESVDGLMAYLREQEVFIWSQGGRVKTRPAEIHAEAQRAIERYADLLVWALERRLNPSWWRPGSEIWFGDRLTAIEFQWRKRAVESKA